MKRLQTIDMAASNFFKQLLLERLIDSGAITAEQARDIAVQTATFCHEIGDEEGAVTNALAIARGYEMIAEAL